MIVIFVASNVAIALAYVVLGFWISPRFDIVGVPAQVAICKYALLAFFTLCAVTHIEQAIHVVGEPRASVEWMLSWHMVISHFLQAIAAPLAAFFTLRFLHIAIVPVDRQKDTP